MCVNKKKIELKDNCLLSSFIRLALKNDPQLNLFLDCILKGLYLIFLSIKMKFQKVLVLQNLWLEERNDTAHLWLCSWYVIQILTNGGRGRLKAEDHVSLNSYSPCSTAELIFRGASSFTYNNEGNRSHSSRTVRQSDWNKG